jgi:hypothetical protein
MTSLLKRYHRTIFLPNTFQNDLEKVLTSFSRKQWLWGFHAVRKLVDSTDKETAKKIVEKVYHLVVSPENVFEVYYRGDDIEKFCVRVSLTKLLDLILVVTKNKTLVTIYVNMKANKHEELDETHYRKE